MATYYEALHQACSEVKPYEAIPGFDSYGGVSARIRKKMLEKVLAQEGATRV